MSQISESEIEDIMIDIQNMNINEIKNVNHVGHIRVPSRIKEEYPETYEKKYKIPKYEKKNQRQNN